MTAIPKMNEGNFVNLFSDDVGPEPVPDFKPPEDLTITDDYILSHIFLVVVNEVLECSRGSVVVTEAVKGARGSGVEKEVGSVVVTEAVKGARGSGVEQELVKGARGLRVFLLDPKPVEQKHVEPVEEEDGEAAAIDNLLLEIASAPEVPDFLPSGPTAAELGYAVIPVRRSYTEEEEA